jgi:hypothetical protein
MYEGRTAAQAGIVFGHEKYVELHLILSIVAEHITHSMGIVDVSPESHMSIIQF